MVPPILSSITGPTETHSFAGILFDLDGTIVDSTNAIAKHWHKWVAAPSDTLVYEILIINVEWARN